MSPRRWLPAETTTAGLPTYATFFNYFHLHRAIEIVLHMGDFGVVNSNY